jgi:hypothetical protein
MAVLDVWMVGFVLSMFLTRMRLAKLHCFFETSPNTWCQCSSLCGLWQQVHGFSASCLVGMGDALAFTHWKLSGLVTHVCNEKLQDYWQTLYIIGDNAYTNSHYCITP